MLFKKKKSIVDVKVFQKACLVIGSCKTYEQLKNARKYADLFYSTYNDYKTYSHLQKLLGEKTPEVFN